MMRIFGVLEIETEMCLTSLHVPGVENTLADQLSRSDAVIDVCDPASPFFGYAQRTIPPQVCAAFLNVLRGTYDLQDWLKAPWRNTPQQ